MIITIIIIIVSVHHIQSYTVNLFFVWKINKFKIVIFKKFFSADFHQLCLFTPHSINHHSFLPFCAWLCVYMKDCA